MKNYLRIAPVVLLAALLAGCQGPCQSISRIDAPKLAAGTADFTTYAAVGTSISAGWQSGGLVNRHQVHAFPALFAQQVGKTVLASGQGTFTFPAVDADGIPALLRIQSLSPLVISNAGATQGSPINLAQPTPYHNMAVPGAILPDFGSTALYNATADRTAMFGIVARGSGAVGTQMLALAPTFISFEFGANEVLGPATSGLGSAYMPITTAQYAGLLTQSMNAIHTAAPNAKLALFNVPNVTSIPFFTTFPPFTADLVLHTPVAINGPSGPLAAGDLITLKAGALLAAGHGFPVGSYNYVNPTAPGLGDSLPDAVVLSSTEKDQIQAAVLAMNTAIDSVANRPWVARVDLNGLLANVAAHGYPVGGTLYTSDFVTGGLFSLDGVHPNDLADALIVNTMIDAVNLRFGATVPRVNVSNYASLTASGARPVLPAAWQGVRARPFAQVQTNLERLFLR